MSLRRSTSIPAELWPRYKFFSDPETQSRLDADPKRLATIQKDPNTVKWERPSSLVVDASWDKYYFFSDPCVGSSVHLTARKGRSRVAANGPNTFGPEFVKKFTPPLDFRQKACRHDARLDVQGPDAPRGGRAGPRTQHLPQNLPQRPRHHRQALPEPENPGKQRQGHDHVIGHGLRNRSSRR